MKRIVKYLVTIIEQESNGACRLQNGKSTKITFVNVFLCNKMLTGHPVCIFAHKITNTYDAENYTRAWHVW